MKLPKHLISLIEYNSYSPGDFNIRILRPELTYTPSIIAFRYIQIDNCYSWKWKENFRFGKYTNDLFIWYKETQDIPDLITKI